MGPFDHNPEQHRPPDIAASRYTNHLKITHEALRRHLTLTQAERRLVP